MVTGYTISQKKKYKYPITFSLILLLGIDLRIYKLDSYDLWYDEAYIVFNIYTYSNFKTLI